MANGCCAGRQAAGPASEKSSHALEILKERFARGEIDKAEYEEKRQIISDPLEKVASASGSSGCGCC